MIRRTPSDHVKDSVCFLQYGRLAEIRNQGSFMHSKIIAAKRKLRRIIPLSSKNECD